MRNLVIVESAAKAKTIQKYLNAADELKDKGTFVVVASLGHVVDLPRKDLGVDKTTWVPRYEPLPDKLNIIKRLKDEVKKADRVYLASDPDLEGEAIANNLKDTLNLSKVLRITFNEITKYALVQAVLHPRAIDKQRVKAQESRRILDRIVGYELSPLLWKRFASPKLSAGRVQSAALKMLVDKMEDTKNHTAEQYWEVGGTFKWDDQTIDGTAHLREDKKTAIWNQEEDALDMVKYLAKKSDKKWIATFTVKEAKRNPSAPFVTSSLQQEAYARLGLPAKKTMQIAQGLYEQGLITYMRTDSALLSSYAQNAVADYVEATYGKSFVVIRQYKGKLANAQNAHECIRPAKIHVLPRDTKLEGVSKKLYDLIWRRTIASQMKPAVFAEIHSTITCQYVDQEFCGKTDVLIDEGFLKVYSPDMKAKKEAITKWRDTTVEVQPIVFQAFGDVTRPPALLNEPALVRTLEKAGIGRPSTYATIVDKLLDKAYVMKGVNPHNTIVPVATYKWERSKGIDKTVKSITVGGTDTDKFIPTSLGERVVEYLTSIVPSLVSIRFTANMEALLDDIAEGKTTKDKVLTDFYTSFSAAVETARAKQVEVQKANKGKGMCDKDAIKPKTVLRSFQNLGIDAVQTRFGVALYSHRERKFVSVMPFLKWRNKDLNSITERDVKFLFSFPITFDETKRVIEYGRYGLYIKDGKSNIHLKKELWDAVYSGTLDAQEVMKAKPFEKQGK